MVEGLRKRRRKQPETGILPRNSETDQAVDFLVAQGYLVGQVIPMQERAFEHYRPLEATVMSTAAIIKEMDSTKIALIRRLSQDSAQREAQLLLNNPGILDPVSGRKYLEQWALLSYGNREVFERNQKLAQALGARFNRTVPCIAVSGETSPFTLPLAYR